MRRRFLFLFGMVLVATACERGQQAADIESAKAAGQPIVQKLNDYRRKHGRYPDSLKDAEIATVATKLGTFQYERRGDANAEYFVLLVGDHNKNGFVLFWNSEMASHGWLVEE